MLALRRRFELPDLALRRFDGRLTLGIRAYVVETRGVVFDTAVQTLGLGATVQREGQLAVVLDGEYVFRRIAASTPTTLRRGDVVLAPVDGWDERWDGGRFRVLVLEWESSHGDRVSTTETFKVDAALLALLDRFADSLLDGHADVPWFVDAARAMGAPVKPCSEWPITPIPEPIARVHAALSTILTAPTDAPRWVDVEDAVGVHERTVRRWLRANPAWFGWYPDFRRTILYWKLSSASMLVTARGSRIEDVARLTGYGSSRGLIYALESHGVAAPSEIKRALGVGQR